MPPTIHIDHYLSLRNKQNRNGAPILLFHANVFKARACLKDSNFLKVRVLDTAPHSQAQHEVAQAKPDSRPEGGTVALCRNPLMRFLFATSLIYASGAGNYRGCWRQTCPPIDTRKKDLNFDPSNYKTWMPCTVFLSLPPCVRIG